LQSAWLPILWAGLLVTLRLSVVTIVASSLLAVLLATASISPVRALRRTARLYVDLMRCIPHLALLIFVYYGLGKYIASWHVDPFWLAAFALTLGESVFLSEIFRVGLEAIPRAQWEAATSLGFRWRSCLRYVIAPQVLLPSIPGLVNMSILTIKDSSLASFVAVPEITQAANQLGAETFKPLQVYLLLACFYAALILPFTLASELLERWIRRQYGVNPLRATTARD
jgi:His/Glu/Gln/Arg/opine family amino acid ABC transporter permease subunit